MSTNKTRFSRKLHMAFGAMLAITLALSWYFYDSVKWFEFDIKRITIANSILNGYRMMSVQTLKKLARIEEGVEEGEVPDLSSWNNTDRDLRLVVANIRQDLVEENSLKAPESGTVGLDVLSELEGLTETIISTGEVIRSSLEQNQPALAHSQWDRLKSQGSAELFNGLMSQTLILREKELKTANAQAVSLAHYITGVLPLFMLVLAGITLLVVWLFSRGLTRSVNVLHRGAQAFTSGDLNHRIPELQEKEFELLGQSFNIMARELAGHRTSMRDSQIRLEAMVEERTRALKGSNEMLEMVDENRRQLLADISHEFRTPLTVMRGEAEISLRGKVKTKAEYQDTLKLIVEQADQATRLVDDLLFIARTDAGEPLLKVRPVSVDSLLVSTCADFRARAQQGSMTIEHDVEGANVVVMGDEGRLRQVFSILIDNALRYSSEGGRISVKLERGKKDIVVTIVDTGIGLTDEEAQRAFKRFFRGREAQDHARGTGLGLPVAKAIVEAHQGQITLEGSPGEGAVATVVLPAENTLEDVA